MSDHSGNSGEAGMKPISLKHRILSRPNSDQTSHLRGEDSKYTTPVPSPAGSHNSDNHTPLKKRLRIADNSSDSSSMSSAANSMSTSGQTTPCPSPNLRASPSDVPVANGHQPNQFTRGSLIQLANGELKTIEQMSSDDFVKSAAMSPGLQVERSSVVRIERNTADGNGPSNGIVIYFRVGPRGTEIAVEASVDHPFFVVDKGWSSVSPPATLGKFGLTVAQLAAGDTCISLSNKELQREPLGVSNSAVNDAIDSRFRSSAQNGVSTDSQLHPATSENTTCPTMTSATCTSNEMEHLVSFRRWSAPEDDRFLGSLPK